MILATGDILPMAGGSNRRFHEAAVGFSNLNDASLMRGFRNCPSTT